MAQVFILMDKMLRLMDEPLILMDLVLRLMDSHNIQMDIHIIHHPVGFGPHPSGFPLNPDRFGLNQGAGSWKGTGRKCVILTFISQIVEIYPDLWYSIKEVGQTGGFMLIMMKPTIDVKKIRLLRAKACVHP